ncbi:MAG: hypothetical protein ACI936_000039 [Paraglaciecola sp.]|jgi:hypothetical protein
MNFVSCLTWNYYKSQSITRIYRIITKDRYSLTKRPLKSISNDKEIWAYF